MEAKLVYALWFGWLRDTGSYNHMVLSGHMVAVPAAAVTRFCLFSSPQTQQQKFVNWQGDAEYRGENFTAAVTLGNPDVLVGSGRSLGNPSFRVALYIMMTAAILEAWEQWNVFGGGVGPFCFIK